MRHLPYSRQRSATTVKIIHYTYFIKIIHVSWLPDIRPLSPLSALSLSLVLTQMCGGSVLRTRFHITQIRVIEFLVHIYTLNSWPYTLTKPHTHTCTHMHGWKEPIQTCRYCRTRCCKTISQMSFNFESSAANQSSIQTSLSYIISRRWDIFCDAGEDHFVCSGNVGEDE